VQLGVQDVQHAYAADPALGDAELLAHVRATSPAPAKANKPNYAPEQAFPKVDPTSKQGDLTWKVADFATLWKTPVRTDRPAITYGERIKQSMQQAGGDFHKELVSLGAKFKTPVKKLGSTLHLDVAYEQGFRDPILCAGCWGSPRPRRRPHPHRHRRSSGACGWLPPTAFPTSTS
jgi:hypothetical protein